MEKKEVMSKRQISSSLTFFYKFIFATTWPIGFGYGTYWCFLNNYKEKHTFLFMWILGSLFLWWGCARLKYVAIEGNNLIISNFIRTIQVPFVDIERITENRFINIHPIWIHFKKTTGFGDKIMFMPGLGKRSIFHPHTITKELRDLSGTNKR